jgi:uncharacterized membrane protein
MEGSQILWGTMLIVAYILIPGVAVTFGLFPRKDQISLAERFGLALVFGLLPQLLLYFLTRNFAVPVTTETSYIASALVTAAGLIAWKMRGAKERAGGADGLTAD